MATAEVEVTGRATGLTTRQALDVVTSLTVTGVPFSFTPAYLEPQGGCVVTVPGKHTETLKVAVKHATERVPTVGKGDKP